MSNQKEKEEQSSLAWLLQNIDEMLEENKKDNAFWLDWLSDTTKKLEEPLSKDKRLWQIILRERTMSQGKISINQGIYLLFLKIITEKITIQSEQISQLEKREPHEITDEERERTKAIHEENIKALMILKKMIGEQNQIREREQLNIV